MIVFILFRAYQIARSEQILNILSVEMLSIHYQINAKSLIFGSLVTAA